MSKPPIAIANVISWTFQPTSPDAIHGFLKALTDDELGTMMDFTGAAGVLGWLEYGRRKGHLPCINLQVVEVRGKFEVNVGMPAPVVVENVILGGGGSDD